jgi:hypothetical protein
LEDIMSYAFVSQASKDSAVSIFTEALTQGLLAGKGHNPQPMTVVAGPPSGEKIIEVVPDGVCGFAWVHVSGNSWFIRAMKAAGFAEPSKRSSWGPDSKRYLWTHAYGGGFEYWVSEFNQSYERKLACAQKMAEVLNNYGVEAYASGRLD